MCGAAFIRDEDRPGGGPDITGRTLRRWDGLNADQRSGILALGRRVRVDGLTWLETYCEPGDTLAFVLAGRVALRPVSVDVEDRWDMSLASGPVAIRITSDPAFRNGHWVSEASDVTYFDQSALDLAFQRVPAFAGAIVDLLFDQKERLVRDLTEQNVLGMHRLAKALAGRIAGPSDRPVAIRVTQTQLAFESGLSRQWVNRLLSVLERRGIAETGRGRVIVHAPDALRALL